MKRLLTRINRVHPQYYNNSLITLHIYQIWLFFIPETKNKIEGKTVRHYFEHPEGFD